MFVFAVATGEVQREIGRSRSICCRHPESRCHTRAQRRFTVQRPEMNAMFRTLYCIYGMGDKSTYIYVVQRHIAPRARLRLVWGSLTLAQLYSVYRERSRVCCRIVTSAAGTSDNTATDE